MSRSRLWAAALTLFAAGCSGDMPAPVAPEVTPRMVGTASVTELDANFEQISFENGVDPTSVLIGQNATIGFSHKYENAITVGTQAVDAVVTLTDFGGTNSPTLDAIDDEAGTETVSRQLQTFFTINGSSTEAATGFVKLKIEFFLGGTSTPVALKNFAFYFRDVDALESVESDNVSTARTATSSNLTVTANNGVVRAKDEGDISANSSDPNAWVEFRYNSTAAVNLHYTGTDRLNARVFLVGTPAPWETTTTSDTPGSGGGGADTPLTIVADDKSVAFNGSAPTYSYTFKDASGNVVSAPAGLSGLSCTAPYTAGTTGVGTVTITCSGASAAGYTFSYETGTLTVTAIPLVIVADDKSVVFAGAAPSYTHQIKDGSGNVVSAPIGFSPPTCTAAYTAGTTGVGTADITCSDASAANYSFTYQKGTLTVTKASPAAAYTGTTGVYTTWPTAVSLSTTLSIPACTGAISYTIAPDPATGTGSRTIATNASTTGWLPGIYEITAAYPGNTNCNGSSDLGVLIFASPGDATTGGGHYFTSAGTQSNVRVNFGHTVQSTSQADRKTGLTTIRHHGNLLWMVKEGWRFKGRVASTTVRNSTTGAFVSGDQESLGILPCPAGVGTADSKPKCGFFRGTGVLQRWDAVTSTWITATTFGSSGTLPFTATIYDGGSVSTCKAKNCSITDYADSFGLALEGVRNADGVPVGAPVEVRKAQNGSIHIR